MTQRGTLFIISAPSGAGKTSLVNALVERDPDIQLSTSYTTRPIRPGEREGVDYFFVNQKTFKSMRERCAFLESAEVFGNYYGTSRQEVDEHLEDGTDVILEIDWQGAQQVRKSTSDCVSVFILPPSRDTLRERLEKRGRDEADTIEKRLAEAVAEMSHYSEFDYLVVNDDFETAVADLQAIMRARRLETPSQAVERESLIADLLS